jgi:sulfide:quinone oxidoreductase
MFVTVAQFFICEYMPSNVSFDLLLANPMSQHHQILIIGAGTGGTMVAAQLKRQDRRLDIAILEPSKDHWYQPAWTLVGAGTFSYEATRRNTADYIPRGVRWIQDYAEGFDPQNKRVRTRASGDITYDYLVVAPGLQMDIDALPGLREGLATPYVCSNYVDPRKTWEVIRNFKGGNAVFTQPATPIKCGGAPQKIMYLAEEAFQKSGVRSKTEVVFATPGSVIFGVKEFADTLMNVIYHKHIHLKTHYAPVKIDPERKEVHFKYIKPGENACVINEDNRLGEQLEGDFTVIMPYDMLHLAPPQSAPDFIKHSPLAHAEGPNKGWMNVDIHSLQHLEYPEIFGIGDVAALPTAKTGAAIRKQAPVVVDNILHMIRHQGKSEKAYSGYSSCPLVTGYGKMVLAEFKYNNVRDSDPLLSRFVDTTKEQWSMWVLKKYGLPWLYWNQMMRGRM